MLIWRGYGIVVVLIPAGILFLISLILESIVGPSTYQQNRDLYASVGLVIAAPFVWMVGRHLNTKKERVFIDQATGQQVVVRPDHSLFFIKIEYWAFVIGVWGMLLLISQLK